MGFFDLIQKTAFTVITTTFGVTAKWIPYLGAEPVVAEVLYNDPTERQPIIDADFEIEGCVMEYKAGDLPGLKEAVNSGGALQAITIQHQGGAPIAYWVKEVTSKFDGKTLTAKIVQR